MFVALFRKKMYLCGKVMYSKLIIREMEELQDKYVRFDWAIKVRHEVLMLIV